MVTLFAEPGSPPGADSRARAVEISGLNKSYGHRKVVDDLDLTVYSGEIVGLIGANGAGKTTTVEIVQGLRRADSGSVRVLGADSGRETRRVRRRIGSQLQDSALPDRMRVLEAVQLFAEPWALAPGPLLEKFGLEHRRKSAFGSMSGGEQQRLFLVLALLNRPRLVILDELTQGLDPAARREVWSAVTRLRSDGVTVLLVTHEVNEAEALCERVVVMRDGRKITEGTPSELVSRSAGAATAAFTWDEDADRLAADLRDLDRLAGVRRVRRRNGRIHVDGDAELIARLGAWLMSSGRPVPSDLCVAHPTLEQALIGLLGSSAPSADPTRQGR
ncbi:ABC transporter ATP-binding protein [Tomitella gaofuii]|uniref:ABC transporter ATP-binding protein n=1 Tax=Tomitella gaofuii TaxID=2760083 RepID=UPI0015FD9141|nr:ABC transporter ATP-binding protein [Tomitella gaofuii]